MNSIITVDGQRELNYIIFSCGTILYSKNLYTARHLKIGKQTTLIKETTSESSNDVTSTVSPVVNHAKATVNSAIDFSLKALKIETSSCKCQTS